MCKWIVDADQIQMRDFDNRILYRTETVDSFVYNDRNLGIEGPKGLGKTYLMKSKRMLSQQEGILCLPQDAMCDILDKVTFEESMGKYLQDYANWVDLWKAAICISIHKACIQGEELEEQLLNAIKEENNKSDELYLKIYFNPFITTTCQIMNKLINSERSLVRSLQTRIPFYMAVVKKIRKPVHIFIDKTDQALRDNLHYIGGASKMSRGPSNSSYWSFGQLALAEASYQIFIQNSHIKVFYSIRSEALVGAESFTNLFVQLKSYMVKLEYSFFEMKQMFEHYVSIEDDKWLIFPEDRHSDPARAFVGINSIEHGYVTNEAGEHKIEQFFSYLFRHSLKRPRDIMHICYRLCYSQLRNLSDDNSRKKEIRHVVNQESRLLLQSYLREMGPFVFDNNDEKWDIFWKMIDTNVFSYDYAQELCSLINASTEENTCMRQCNSCPEFKPFSALYNTGLLGVVAKNNVDDDPTIIRFQSTGQTIIQTNEEILPHVSLYFLHPMVTNKVEAVRLDRNNNFDICRELIVGDGYEIDENSIVRIRRKEDDRRNRKRAKSIFLSSTCFDLHDCRRMIYRELARYDYQVVMSERNDFGMPLDDINSYDFCLDKVSECNQLIYIIGERYGGPYRGIKYKSLADEIKQINPRIGEPSISMMEFYLAKKLGKTTRVFTKKDIYNERSTYEKNKDNTSFKPAFAQNIKVFEIISTITRLETGNWFKTYEDLDDLLEIIKIEFGNRDRVILS